MAGPVRALMGMATACALALGAAPAFADNAGKPMTFEWGTVFGDTQAIFADGDFTLDTPAALRAFLKRSVYTPDTVIYLNSLGGDLGAGMEVGKIIRESHLNTGVARNQREPDQANTIDLDAYSRVYPGYCVSACSLAFLGGVSREVKKGATYAVHQVSMNCVEKSKARSQYPWVLLPNITYCPDLNEALSMVQIANGAVVDYVRSMGADPIFLTEMSKAGPDKINPLTEDQLNAYHINFAMRTESWSYETDAQGQFFLQYKQGDEWKEDRVEFFCNRTAAPRLYLWVVHDTRRSTQREDAQRIVDLAGKGLTVFWQFDSPRPDGFADIRNVSLQSYEIIEPPKVTENDNITLTIDVSQRFLDVLTGAQRFQIVTTEPDTNGVEGFRLISINLDRDRLAGIVRSCK
ncbi:MAG TPA: hypothetical protein VGO52_02935 [Hyphomonadaceae bacterium]|nr:hypothetical protein [Hyphomonadaceae bacterium]